MIFHKGAYEKTQLFYKINNKSSRKHFIEQIKLEIDTELNDFKNNCDSHHKNLLRQCPKCPSFLRLIVRPSW